MSGNLKESSSQKVLNQVKGNKVIWIVVFFLTMISFLVVYSSSSTLAFRRHSSNFSIVLTQLKFVLIGWVALYICYKIPIKWYRILSAIAFYVTIGLLGLTLIVGKDINGAIRGIGIGGFTFQPSELAKITIVLYLARVIEIKPLETFWKYVVHILVPVGIAGILIAWGSISMALLVGIIVLVVLYVTGVNRSYILKTIGIFVAGGALLVLTHFISGGKAFPRLATALGRIERFTKGSDKDETKELTKEEIQALADENLQEDMARIAVVSGKLLGKGPGKSTQRFLLPHPYSDFAFAIIIEEYGLLVASIIIFFYMWLFYNCISLSMSCKTVFSSVIVSGLGFGIVFQAFLHILVNVGILPITGHTLPMISLGGSSLILIMASIGIILSVSRTKEEIDTLKKVTKQKSLQKREKELTDIDKNDLYNLDGNGNDSVENDNIDNLDNNAEIENDMQD